MPARRKNGRFVKSSHRRRARRAAPRRTRTVYKTRRVTWPDGTYVGGGKRRRGHRRHRGHGGGVGLKHLAIAGAGLAFLTGAGSPIQAIPTNIAKLPGAKTFGGPAVAGLACLAVDRFFHRNKWLRAAGWIGVGLAAVQVGTKGKDFAWVGDAPGQLRGPSQNALRGFSADVEAGTLDIEDEEYDEGEDELDDELDGPDEMDGPDEETDGPDED